MRHKIMQCIVLKSRPSCLLRRLDIAGGIVKIQNEVVMWIEIKLVLNGAVKLRIGFKMTHIAGKEDIFKSQAREEFLGAAGVDQHDRAQYPRSQRQRKAFLLNLPD